MREGVIVLLKTVSMFLLILVGWAVRRPMRQGRALLEADTVAALSRFVVAVTFPALVFTQMLDLDASQLRACWYYPLLGAAVILIGELAGLATMPFFTRRGQRATFVFLVAICNWIYLPLPIMEGLLGAEGVRAVLLFNVGTQVVLWTLGVWTLQGGLPAARHGAPGRRPDTVGGALRELALNPGLIATAAGIILALALPGWLRTLSAPTAPFPTQLAQAVVGAMSLLGSLTVPLSLIVTGAQLAAPAPGEKRSTSPLAGLPTGAASAALAGVLASRLILAPLATIALVRVAAAFGLLLPEAPRLTVYVISAMPVAISCSILAERFGGDTALAARSIFYSTLLSIATMPALVWLSRAMGW